MGEVNVNKNILSDYVINLIVLRNSNIEGIKLHSWVGRNN